MEGGSKRSRTEDPTRSGTVRFNVGGRIFEVLREPTLSLHPGTLLQCLAEDHDGDDPIFVEADPDVFPYVLQYFRDRKILIPQSVSKAAVLREAAKLGLTSVTPDHIEQDPVPFGELYKEMRRVTDKQRWVLWQSQAQMLADIVLLVVYERAPSRPSIVVSCDDIRKAMEVSVGNGWVQLRGSLANELVNKSLGSSGMTSVFDESHPCCFRIEVQRVGE